LEDLSLKEYQRFYDGFTEEIKEKIKLEKAVNSRNHKGGTATAAVLERIREFEKNSGEK